MTATTFVGGRLLADWDFSTLVSPGAFDELASATFEFDVGTVVRLASRMTLLARAEFFATAEADALHTSRFYVDVLTPGGGYVTGGGVVFAAVPAVPEPASALLFAAGVLLLGAGGWRRGSPGGRWSGAPRRAAARLGA